MPCCPWQSLPDHGTAGRAEPMGADVRDDLVLSRAVVTADVSAPFAHVNIEQWLKTQQALEYQQRPTGHNKNAGYSEAMSFNAEVIGKGIVSERYRMEVGTPTTARWCQSPILSRHHPGGPLPRSSGSLVLSI